MCTFSGVTFKVYASFCNAGLRVTMIRASRVVVRTKGIRSSLFTFSPSCKVKAPSNA